MALPWGDMSSGRRGGLRSHRRGARGRTKEQLYEEARSMGIKGRSTMTKAELVDALQKANDRASAQARS